MSRLIIGLTLVSVLLTACAREETGEGEDATVMDDTMAVAPEPAGISLVDVAGTWVVEAQTETGEAVPQFELLATADPTGWEMRFPDRDPIEVSVVEVAGDSIVTEAGPYESVLRPGVPVRVHAVYRLEGDRLISRTVARYETTGADSVVSISSEGTRAP